MTLHRGTETAETYLAAATLMAEIPFLFVTSAIARAVGIQAMSSACDRMSEYFDTGWADWDHEERILALCFMAAMVAAGDA